MAINPFDALAQSSHRGQIYYFCSQECKQKFDKDPQKYVSRVAERESNH